MPSRLLRSIRIDCRIKTVLMLSVLGLGVLNCRSKTDDEIWLERIHSSPVYGYAALKILVGDPERDDDVRETRKLFEEFLATPVPAEAPDPAETARRAFTLGHALWKLRDLGEAEVAKGRDSKLLVFSPPGAPSDPTFTPETEHGFLLLFLLVSKLDSRAPLPAPPEAMLYEAYMAGEARLPDALIDGLVTSAQTAVTAEAELCDVAGRFSDKLAQLAIDVDSGAVRSLLAGALIASSIKGPAGEDALARTLVDALPWGMRLLAYGRAAMCFDKRKQTEEARVQWERLVALAAQAGVPEADLALVQAYAAYRAKDWPQTRIHLQRASSSTLLTPDERVKVLQMAERFDEKDPGPFESMFDRAFVTRTLLGIVDERLRKAGVYDRLLELPRVVAVRRAVNVLSDPTRSVDDAGWWQQLRNLWSNNEGK